MRVVLGAWIWRDRAPAEASAHLAGGGTVDQNDLNTVDWIHAGYIELVSPVRPPQAPSTTGCASWCSRRFPRARIHAQRSAEGRPGLQLPVCASRQALGQLFDELARLAFAAALAECEPAR